MGYNAILLARVVRAAQKLSQSMVEAEQSGVDFEKVENEWQELTASLTELENG